MALNIERPQVSSATRESLIGTGETEYSRHNGSYSTSLTAHASVHSLDLLFIQLFEAITGADIRNVQVSGLRIYFGVLAVQNTKISIESSAVKSTALFYPFR